MERTGFFTKTPVLQNKRTTPLSYINVGGEPFHAVAVALIDSWKNTHFMKDASLKMILERFFAYYPKFKLQQAYLKPAERMDMILSGPRKSEIVDCMAYVLRQLAVDEMYANPLNYKEIFEGLNSATSRNFLRKPDTVMPVSALRALTESLGITIILSFTEQGKELRYREMYSNSSASSSHQAINLQVQGNQCFPGVKNKGDFTYVGQLAINPPVPQEFGDEKKGTIAGMVGLIAEDNKRLLHSYQQWRQNLLTMIVGNELTTAFLIDLYIDFLPPVDSIFSNTKEFFAKLTGSDKIPVTFDCSNSNTQLNELLASALAGWISLNKIDVERLFERLEEGAGRNVKDALKQI